MANTTSMRIARQINKHLISFRNYSFVDIRAYLGYPRYTRCEMYMDDAKARLRSFRRGVKKGP